MCVSVCVCENCCYELNPMLVLLAALINGKESSLPHLKGICELGCSSVGGVCSGQRALLRLGHILKCDVGRRFHTRGRRLLCEVPISRAEEAKALVPLTQLVLTERATNMLVTR
jgi:hypothetical protein